MVKQEKVLIYDWFCLSLSPAHFVSIICQVKLDNCHKIAMLQLIMVFNMLVLKDDKRPKENVYTY